MFNSIDLPPRRYPFAAGRVQKRSDQISDKAVTSDPLEGLLAQLQSTTGGLTSAAARIRLARFGPNDPADTRREPPWLQFLARFRNPLVIILLVASALSAATGEIASFLIVVAIVGLSTSLDFFQEFRAHNAVDALRRSVALHAAARRDGVTHSLPVRELVPGDVIDLTAGDLVPADCRLIESRDLFVNQALLTGEPYPAEKRAEISGSPTDGSDGTVNTVFAGTSVISGTATVLVCRTGHCTRLGGLAASLAEKPPATAFAVGIRRFGLLILRFTVLLVLFVLAVNLAFHRPALESLMFALALAVGLTPELLPMIITVTLSRAAIELARRKVIVKRLAAIHDLGAMDLLCTDKTGTLTEASIELVRVIDGEGKESPAAFAYAYLNSHFESGLKSPLDTAILARSFDAAGWVKIDEVPFDFERRRVSVLVQRDDARRLLVKGAPEDMLRLSSCYEAADGKRELLDNRVRAIFMRTFASLGAEGYRALGIAIRDIDATHTSAAVADEAELVFAGFAVFLDPPKASAGATIHELAAAGIAVKVLTGDNELVARHVFGEIGVPVTGVLTGEELAVLSQEALLARLSQVNLFCRVDPQQKLRVLLALKRSGYVVGFMGDGINDAPALHAADVGISVDGAADVARDAADLILLEHDLSVVQQAVMHGRSTVRNVAKYILMGSSSNFGNMFSMAGAALFLPFLPMLPTQVLLNNLLYDTSQIAIPFDTVDPEDVAQPVRWDMRFIERFMLVFGPISSVFDFLTFYVLVRMFAANETLFHTGWFIESLATQVLVVFAIRTRRPLFRSPPHRFLASLAAAIVTLAVLLPFTPPAPWLGFVGPNIPFFLYLAVAVIAYLGLVEAVKRYFYPIDLQPHRSK